jgi:hypothetical protein
MYGSVNGEAWRPVRPDGLANYSSILPAPRPPTEVKVGAAAVVDDMVEPMVEKKLATQKETVDDPVEPMVEKNLTTQKENDAASTLLQLHPFPVTDSKSSLSKFDSIVRNIFGTPVVVCDTDDQSACEEGVVLTNVPKPKKSVIMDADDAAFLGGYALRPIDDDDEDIKLVDLGQIVGEVDDQINMNVADDDQSLNPDCLGEVPVGFKEEHIMVPSLDEKGKPIDHAIKDWVDQCFRDQNPPMDTPDEIRRTIHIWTYDHIAAIKQELNACMRETRRQFLKMKIARLRDVIREEQRSLDINVKYFTDIYLKSTRTVVTGLSFVPDKCNKRDGHFVGLFEYDGHRTGKRVREEIAVDEGWTEESLEPGIAAYVKKMTISKTIDPESFFDIPPTTAYLDMRPIWKVNYYPPRTVVSSVVETAAQARERGHKSADGLYKKKVKTRMVPEKWKVMYQDRSMEVKSRQFLVERFGKTYLNLVKAGASKKGFFPVPPGSAKDKGANVIPVPTPRAAAVKVKYPQKQLNTCVFSSFASALNHAGFVEHAARVNLAGIDRFFKSAKPMQDLCQFVRGELGLGLHITKFGRNTTVRDLAAGTSEKIVLVLLHGSDQRSDHVVAIYNGLIFDSNVEMAMPFCRENLDYCCTDSTGEPSFSHFVKGYTFHRKAGMGAGRSKKKQKRNKKQ